MFSNSVKGEQHPKPKISMFYALSQNSQHLEKVIYEWYRNVIEILVGQAVFKLRIKIVKLLF